mmetsp:Transcript_16011/g.30833  ORF Transcript_16011/g.30833 Transcript_16011/m.30833 type:complete len:229 (+) Transcript_16011:376-1062(+)
MRTIRMSQLWNNASGSDFVCCIQELREEDGGEAAPTPLRTSRSHPPQRSRRLEGAVVPPEAAAAVDHTARFVTWGLSLVESWQHDGLDHRVASLLDSLEPELLALALLQDLPRRLANRPALVEKLWDSGVVFAVIEDKELLRSMLQKQVILRMLEAGLLTHISQARLRGFRELIATGALKDLLDSGVVCAMLTRGSARVLQEVLNGHMLEALVQTSLLNHLLASERKL